MSTEPARYRGTDFVASPAADGQEILVSRLDGRTRLVPARTGALLARCDGFHSLDDHARRICHVAGLPPGRAVAVRRYLAALAAEGLLTSADETLRRCRAQPAPAERMEPIAMIGVPSCDRPETVARGLRSYMRNTRDHGRDVEFVLMDDSRREDSRHRNEAALHALSGEYGTRAAYATQEDRRAYADRLVKEGGLPPETVAFALLRTEDGVVSTGACRNALLLHGVGDRFVHVDDDTICNVAAAQGAERGVALVGVHAGMEHSFYATGEDARAAVSFHPQDYVGLYDTVLGRTVADVLAAVPNGDPIDLDGAPPELVRRLQEGPCPVVAASLGVAGDSGLGSSEMYFFTGNAVSRQRLFDFAGGYRRAFESQQVVRSTRRATLAETGFCVGIALGLDHRRLLPPFMPVLRNSDGAFAKVRSTCFPDTAMAFLPWVVEHTPPTVRRSSLERVLDGAGRAGVPEFLSWFVRSLDAAPLPRRPERRLVELGRHLVRVGSLPPRDYADECRRMLRRRLEGVTRYVEQFEASCGDGPPGWREDVAAYVARVREVAELADAIAPVDLTRAGAGPVEAIRRGQALVRSYGDLLCAWPAIVEAARVLRRRGHRPARSVA